MNPSCMLERTSACWWRILKSILYFSFLLFRKYPIPSCSSLFCICFTHVILLLIKVKLNIDKREPDMLGIWWFWDGFLYFCFKMYSQLFLKQILKGSAKIACSKMFVSRRCLLHTSWFKLKALFWDIWVWPLKKQNEDACSVVFVCCGSYMLEFLIIIMSVRKFWCRAAT